MCSEIPNSVSLSKSVTIPIVLLQIPFSIKELFKNITLAPCCIRNGGVSFEFKVGLRHFSRLLNTVDVVECLTNRKFIIFYRQCIIYGKIVNQPSAYKIRYV